MRLRVRNLTCKSNTDDYYSLIDLNNIFNDDDILDEWIREGEQPMLPPDDLGWLDEGIRRSDESGGDGDDDVMAVMITAVMVVAVMVMTAIMEVMAVMMKRLMVLVETNEVVLLCHGIQIIMPYRIQIMEARDI